jgi:hypothetical protein
MAMEFSTMVHQQTGVQLPTMLVMGGPSIAQLARRLVEQLASNPVSSSSPM